MNLSELDDRLILTALLLIAIMVLLYAFSGLLNALLKDISQRWFALTMNLLVPVYNRAVGEYKKELFSLIIEENEKGGTILEIGAGSGGSLQFYPKTVPIALIAVEPNRHCEKYLRHNVGKFNNITLDRYVINFAEDMKDIESNSIATVISTIVMCSVENQAKALKEIKRVLIPGGKYYFMEHVIDESHSWLSWLQLAMNKLWNILFDGCNINRNTSSFIENAGFRKVKCKRFMASKLSSLFIPIYPHIAGYAEK